MKTYSKMVKQYFIVVGLLLLLYLPKFVSSSDIIKTNTNTPLNGDAYNGFNTEPSNIENTIKRYGGCFSALGAILLLIIIIRLYYINKKALKWRNVDNTIKRHLEDKDFADVESGDMDYSSFNFSNRGVRTRDQYVQVNGGDLRTISEISSEGKSRLQSKDDTKSKESTENSSGKPKSDGKDPEKPLTDDAESFAGAFQKEKPAQPVLPGRLEPIDLQHERSQPKRVVTLRKKNGNDGRRKVRPGPPTPDKLAGYSFSQGLVTTQMPQLESGKLRPESPVKINSKEATNSENCSQQ